MAEPIPLILVLGLFMFGILSVSWIVPIAVPPPPETTIPPDLVSADSDYNYLESVCPCRTNLQAGVDFGSNERTISNTYFAHGPNPDPDPRGLTSFAWAWGQFIAHDITLSVNDDTIPPLSVPFGQDNINITLPYIKTRLATGGCQEPHNGLSQVIDASTVYSDYKDPARMSLLRENGNACELILNDGYVPVVNGSLFCGDVRCGEHVVLTTLHTLFAREHNRWCTYFAAQEPTLTDNERFYAARQQVIGIIQKITYLDWLPSVLGSQESLLNSVPELGIEGRLSNAFSLVAFRFGHSMVPDDLGPWPLEQLFFNNTFLPTQGIEAVIQATLDTPAEQVDAEVVDVLRNILFGMFGMDLVTLNLFHARQVGVGTYLDLVSCYGTTPLAGVTASDDRNFDPLLGLLSEPLVAGSSLPRTMAVIVAENFRRIRKYDPYYFTNLYQTLGQERYNAITQSTLRSVVLRNTGMSGALPLNFFQV